MDGVNLVVKSRRRNYGIRVHDAFCTQLLTLVTFPPVAINFGIGSVTGSPEFFPSTVKSNMKLPFNVEYTVFLNAGQRDWYFQEAVPGVVFVISLEVIQGPLGKVGFTINDPDGKPVIPFDFRRNVTFKTEDAKEGYYSFLIDNKFSGISFATAKVAIYVSCYEPDSKWSKIFSLATGLFNSPTTNLSLTMSKLRRNIAAMQTHLQLSRKLEGMDYSLLKDNQSMVTNWSLLQCMVIIIVGGLHVYFIRQFFNTSTRKISQTLYPTLNFPNYVPTRS